MNTVDLISFLRMHNIEFAGIRKKRNAVIVNLMTIAFFQKRMQNHVVF